MKKIFWLPLVLIVPLFAKIVLDDSMSREEMTSTGVANLDYSQKMALQDWINQNFEAKTDFPNKQNEQLYLSLNFDEGAKLELSDGSTYEIASEDRLYTMYWVTPFPISLGQSGDKKYPVKITNLNTGTSVKGKQISKEKLLEESEKRDIQTPAPKIEEKKPDAKPPTTKPKSQKPEPKTTKPPAKQ